MTITALLVDAAVLGSTGAALLLGPRALRAPTADGTPARPGRGRRGGRPEVLLAAVTGLIYLNQLLCSAYLLRVHGGDAGYVARYLPPGWFAEPTGHPVVRALAAHLPAPGLFAPTVLRVQAFLELPFVLSAYATVLHRLSPALLRAVLGSPALVWATAASYTLVFGVVEGALRNPWTVQDVVIRVLSALLTAPLLLRAARRAPGPERRSDTLGLLRFAAELWAVGTLVMVVYDTALLYNLRHLPDRWPETALALALLAATARDRRPGPATTGPGTAALDLLLQRTLVLFLLPALAIRYGLGFAHPPLSAAAALTVALAALATPASARPPARSPSPAPPASPPPTSPCTCGTTPTPRTPCCAPWSPSPPPPPCCWPSPTSAATAPRPLLLRLLLVVVDVAEVQRGRPGAVPEQVGEQRGQVAGADGEVGGGQLLDAPPVVAVRGFDGVDPDGGGLGGGEPHQAVLLPLVGEPAVEGEGGAARPDHRAEPFGGQVEPGLLAQLPDGGGQGVLALVHAAADGEPPPPARRARVAGAEQQQAVLVVEQQDARGVPGVRRHAPDPTAAGTVPGPKALARNPSCGFRIPDSGPLVRPSGADQSLTSQVSCIEVTAPLPSVV